MKVVALACAFLIVFKIEGQPFFVFWWLIFWGVFNPTVHFLSGSLLSIGLLACVSAYPVFISFLLVKPSEVRLSRNFSETLCFGHHGILSVSQASWRTSDLHFCCLLQLLSSVSFCLICLKYPTVAVALKIPKYLQVFFRTCLWFGLDTFPFPLS